MTEEDVPNTTFLKWVVAILGILIIAVASAIGVILYKRATKTMTADEVPQVEQKVTSVSAGDFGEVNVSVPDGYELANSMIDNGKLVLVYVNAEEEKETVYVLNLRDGSVTGQFVLGN